MSRVGLVFVAGTFPEVCLICFDCYVWRINNSAQTTETWFFVMMVLSWAITEVIRYWFYALKLPIIDKCPAFLVWLRYGSRQLIIRTSLYLHNIYIMLCT